MMNYTEELLKRYKDVMVPNYDPANMIPFRGEGSLVWDVEGNRFIDLAGGIAVLGLGHIHPEVVKALQNQSEIIWHVSNYYASVPLIELAEELCQLTFAEKVFFANSGSEVNEAALKLARKFAFDNFGAEKNQIVSFHNSFHGRSLFTVTAGGQEKYQRGFGPLPPKILYTDFNDIDALKNTVNSNTCALIMEPIMAEGGIIDAQKGFVQAVREVCDKNNALLIFDEVQTGLGRTGKLFAYEHFDIVPDILTTAKALGSGFPIGAMLTFSKFSQSFTAGSHGSTFGGNPLAAAVAKATLKVIAQPDILEAVNAKRNIFEEELNRINSRFNVFSEIRGKGLLIGCLLKENWIGQAKLFVAESLKNNLMILMAGQDVIRLAPSLIIEDSLILEAMKIFEKVVENCVQCQI